MQTIEERAKEFAQNYEFVEKDMDCGNCNTCGKCRGYRKYIDIVTEQREIDIEKAWQWIKNTFFPTRVYGIDTWENDFRKTMEE